MPPSESFPASGSSPPSANESRLSTVLSAMLIGLPGERGVMMRESSSCLKRWTARRIKRRRLLWSWLEEH